MKSIFKILSLVALTFLSVSLFSQPLQPTGFPTSNSPNSWSILRGGVDSFHCFIAHDTFPARYNTIVSTPSGDYYYSKVWVSGQKNWFKINDTTGIHNAIVGLQGQITALQTGKVNLSDSTNLWVTINRLSDSTLAIRALIGTIGTNYVNVKDSGSTYVTPYRANITYQPIGSYVTTNTSQTITGAKSFNQGTLFVGSIYGGGNGHLLVSESGGYSSAIFQNKGYVLADSADVTNGLNLKVAYSDTAAMLANYRTGINALNADTATIQPRFALRVAYGDTSAMLSAYKAAIIQIPTKVKYTDTTAMLANYLTGLISIPTKVKYTDTSAMLANYLTGLIAIPTKVKYSDTASMLNNYRTAIIALNADTATIQTRLNNILGVIGSKGSSTFSASGTTLTFSIAHGLGSTPSWINIQPGSADAKGYDYINADATYIYINFSLAPGSGTNNVKFYWAASK